MESSNINQNPEQRARDVIDKMLISSGWVVQSKDNINLAAKKGVAVREYQTDKGPADYVLFVDRKPVGIIEAKREEEGQHLISVEEQSREYSTAKLKYLNNDPLPFVYESTGTITRFTDYHDPKPRSRFSFSFHRPETMSEWIKKGERLRGRFRKLPLLDPEGLRPAQITAIQNLEDSFKHNHPRALIQMATGAGKTYTAATFIYRLLKFTDAKRILFLVDTKNLGEQAEQEFMKFQPKDDNRKFTELYNVQRLNSSYIASDSQVCISTIQRVYSILKGEELDESAEQENPNESTWLEDQYKKKKPMPVVYSDKVPPEQFDFIVIDECHRSIYNLWQQVLDYFDSFLIGLTATPDKRTFGFFNENVVSEYTYEESITDGVNVPYDVYQIDTEISKKGDIIQSGWSTEHRDKLTRAKRWTQEEEDTIYGKNDLDKKVVNSSQIRKILTEYKKVLKRDIFPNRVDNNGEYEVPKTLIFAKTDSHAQDIVDEVRKIFGEGNDFCKKVTYKFDKTEDKDPKTILNKFRNSYYPRVAVTVDMIATGTDVKPLEVLLFMRDVKSTNYFEQMKGRGTRTINDNDLQLVSKTARTKTHFVIVDAIGVTKSKKTDSRPLERKRTVALKDLLGAITIGVAEEDLFLSLANRLIRLDRQITPKEKDKLLEFSNGKGIKQITKDLLNAYDQDKIEESAKVNNITNEEAQQKLIETASTTFNGELNNYIDNIRKMHEQIIDSINLDTITKSEWDKTSTDRAETMVKDFKEYLEENRDEIQALTIFYNQPYKRREITFKMIKEVFELLKINKPTLAPLNVWDAYTALEETKGKRPESELTALISLIRRVTNIDKTLTPFDKKVNENFKKWIFSHNSDQNKKFTYEQIDWLRMIRDQVVNSFHIDIEDLDFTPFDSLGGRGKMYQLFGDDMNNIIDELNEVLAV